MFTEVMETVNENKMIKGLAACAVASTLFGSMFVPIKRYNAGDGIYVQWVMSVSIVIFAFFTWIWEGLPQFHPLAMIGGMLWCIGNATAVPIMKRLGMAIGILIWNTINCLSGWATSYFGLFGLIARPAANTWLNHIGLISVIFGGAMFSLVKRGDAEAEPKCTKVLLERISVDENRKLSDEVKIDVENSANSESANSNHNRIIGIGLALFAGVLYGSTFIPVVYIQDNYIGADQRGLPYVFSHSMGIFLTATMLLVGYCVIKKNNLVIDNQITLPALFAGLIWIIAQTAFFIANENLSQTVSFPIITTIPGCVASMWSVFVFKEIQGSRNLRLLLIGTVITLCGVLMVGLSK